MQATQLGFVFRHPLGELLEHNRFLANCLQQKVAQGAAVQGVELICCCPTFGSDGWPHEVQLGDPGHDRFMGDHCSVLADGYRAPEWRLVGFVACRLDPLGRQRTATIEVLEFVPLERLGMCLVVAMPIGLEEHHRHAGHLSHQAGAPSLGRFHGVESFIALTAK
ncbi:hypothetical protein D3C76_1382570 [compost metagenome]